MIRVGVVHPLLGGLDLDAERAEGRDLGDRNERLAEVQGALERSQLRTASSLVYAIGLEWLRLEGSSREKAAEVRQRRRAGGPAKRAGGAAVRTGTGDSETGTASAPATRRKGRSRLALFFGGDCLGFVQDKHARWIEAMITERDFCLSGVMFYALQVTGGESGRPTRGLNVVITSAGERAAKLFSWAEAERVEAEAAEEGERHAALPDF